VTDTHTRFRMPAGCVAYYRDMFALVHGAH
jgi:hypothetical protein